MALNGGTPVGRTPQRVTCVRGVLDLLGKKERKEAGRGTSSGKFVVTVRRGSHLLMRLAPLHCSQRSLCYTTSTLVADGNKHLALVKGRLKFGKGSKGFLCQRSTPASRDSLKTPEKDPDREASALLGSTSSTSDSNNQTPKVGWT